MWTAWLAVGISVVSLVVSALRWLDARRIGREAGWWIKADREVWFAEDPEVLVVRVRNAGRAEVEISSALTEFQGGRPWGLYTTDQPVVLPGGREQLLELEHSVRGDGRVVIPGDGEKGRLEIDLASGRRIRQQVKIQYY
jgi:hypothetical protein